VNLNVIHVEEDVTPVFLFFHVMSGEVVGRCIGKAVGRRIKMSSIVEERIVNMDRKKCFL
jgi:hypothetical protein